MGCTKLGCSKKDNWNFFNTCKGCGAPRTTPPFTTMPGEKAEVDWEAKYKALEAKQKKDKEKDQSTPETEETKPCDPDDTDTESDADVPDTLTRDLDQLIMKFEKLNTSKLPELAVLKQLVAAKKSLPPSLPPSLSRPALIPSPSLPHPLPIPYPSLTQAVSVSRLG